MSFISSKVKVTLDAHNINILRDFMIVAKTIGYRSLRMMKSDLLLKEGHANVKIRKFADVNRQVFFGYYDITPFSPDSRLLLAIHAPIKNITPEPETEVIVGYYDLNDEKGSFYEIGRSTTWCWQQGCRLQWYPDGSNRKVLYNRLVDGRYGCVIQDIGSKKIIKSYKRPVYAISDDGRWGLTLNFSRLQRLRPGYGYVNFPDETREQEKPQKDGIWRIDMDSGKEEFLFSVADVAGLEILDSMKGAEHYFNHLLFNPAGTRFMFIHLWTKDKKKFGRHITCDIDGKNKFVLNNRGHASHYIWKSNDELLVFSTHQGSGTNYYLYKDKTSSKSVIGQGILKEDGHPSFSPDGTTLLLDTYPDKFREQRLFVYGLDTGEITGLGSFYSPLKFRGESRCDLHPRWSPCGKYVSIDSAHEGKRAMYLINL